MTKRKTFIIVLCFIGVVSTGIGASIYGTYRSDYVHAVKKMESAKQRFVEFSQDQTMTASDLEAVSLDATRWADEVRSYRGKLAKSWYLTVPGTLLMISGAVFWFRDRRSSGIPSVTNNSKDGLGSGANATMT